MSEHKIYPVSKATQQHAFIDSERYAQMYDESINQPESFWPAQANEFLSWSKPWDTLTESDLQQGQTAWFIGGQLNACYNCLDRHLATRGDQVAIIWEGDDPTVDASLTYAQVHDKVCRLANVLKDRGVVKGDRVCIYMPMVPEAAYAMLACARIGAVHSVVFGGFSPQALQDRILDSDCRTVITADEGVRGGKPIPLKANTDQALLGCPNVETVIVVQRTGADVPWDSTRDIHYEAAIQAVSASCEAVPMDSEDPLFILYTSGSTGKPKGVLHTTGGYMLQAAMTHKYIFDYHDGDIYWCTADVGWVTGHTYIIYGPLANGATTLMFEGIPTYPDAGRCWQVVDKHKVNIFYTAPTALRALMGQGNEFVTATSRASLRLLGSVGEPINPEAWEWYYHIVGAERCPIVDTWWQTETGGIMISPLPGVTVTKPGSATFPVPGVGAELVDEEGNQVSKGGGYLTLTKPWPGMLRGIWGDQKRYRETYWSRFSGKYFAGDGAKLDDDGYLWLLGRVDDVMNVSGHRISTTEVESALVSHPSVAEAAVVGANDAMTGQAIIAYVTLRGGLEVGEQVLRDHVATEIGPIAKPKAIYFTPDLPKTRSGKIMRRLLRDVAEGRNLGDTSTLADASVVSELQRRAAELPSED